MIRQCHTEDFATIYTIINDAAEKYRGFIPEDRWKVPYMSRKELRREIDQGVFFWGYERNGKLVGVMGMQHVQDVTCRNRFTTVKAIRSSPSARRNWRLSLKNFPLSYRMSSTGLVAGW